MFQRISHETWANIVPMIAFGIMFTVFVLTTIRALRLSRGERERLAALPLAASDSELSDESPR